MMEVYRISKEKYIRDLSGQGAKIHGGRWNRPGVAALYTSSHRSLALLELIVHFESVDAIQHTFSFARISVPDTSIISIDIDFQEEYYETFNNDKLWSLTDYYFFELGLLGIWVPSIIIPQEKNLILNTTHEDFRSVKIESTESVKLDPRLV